MSQAPWTAHPISGEAAENAIPMAVELGNLTGEAARFDGGQLSLHQGRVGRQPYCMSDGDSFRPGVSQRISIRWKFS